MLKEECRKKGKELDSPTIPSKERRTQNGEQQTEKVPQSPSPVNVTDDPNPKNNLHVEFEQSKPKETPKQSVKDKTNVFEKKVEEKKMKAKVHGQKIAELGLTNTTAQQIKRNHNEVGSPTSPELKKSPKKSKAGDKNAKK